MSVELEREIEAKEKEIHEVAGMEFNVGSPKQLGRRAVQSHEFAQAGEIRQGTHDLDRGGCARGAGGEFSHRAHGARLPPADKAEIDVRRCTSGADQSGDRALHTTFGQTGTATGRLSSANPNLQNIPIRTELGRGIRAAFIAEPGHVLLTADYSQIELRLLAHFSGDSLLVEAYSRGDDIHTLTASQVFGVPPLMVTADHRRQAKVVNFGIVYGLSPFGLSQNLGSSRARPSSSSTRTLKNTMGCGAFIDKTLEEARRDMKVKTLFGRVRPIPTSTARTPTSAALPNAPR
jgi:DNA polymerase-1